jgi:hypothetical protein
MDISKGIFPANMETDMTNKRKYFNLCMQQQLHWLQAIVFVEKDYGAMSPIHLALVKLAIRKKEGI